MVTGPLSFFPGRKTDRDFILVETDFDCIIFMIKSCRAVFGLAAEHIHKFPSAWGIGTESGHRTHDQCHKKQNYFLHYINRFNGLSIAFVSRYLAAKIAVIFKVDAYVAGSFLVQFWSRMVYFVI